MQKYLFIILLCFTSIVYVFSQSKDLHVESGVFVCKADQYLIYMQDEQPESEISSYTIKAINLNSNEMSVIGTQIRNKCVNLSDSAILYPKDSELILWNIEQKRQIVYSKSDQNMSVIGVSYDKNTSTLLLVLMNNKTNELFIKVLNSSKQIIFSQKMKVNEMEMEGVIPVIETSDNFFILKVQDKLYTIDNKKPVLKLISDKCDGFALKNDEVIYYKFVTYEKTEGYSINLITGTNKKIDDSLNEKIYNCEKSVLFTANIDNTFIPTYTICNKSYEWKNNNWQMCSENILYKDNHLIVKIPSGKNRIKETFFQWEFQ